MGTPAPSPRIVSGNTSAVRVAEFRSKNARLDVAVDPAFKDYLRRLSLQFDVPEAEVVRCMLRFAATNHDWARNGLIWRK